MPPAPEAWAPPEADASASYDTPLNSKQEGEFAEWKKTYAPKDSGDDYDLRGAFKAGLKPDPETGHWPDNYKKPNHPTFSDQSIYAKDAPDKAGHWDGDRFVPPSWSPPEADASMPSSAPTPAFNAVVDRRMDALYTGGLDNVHTQLSDTQKTQLDDLLSRSDNPGEMKAQMVNRAYLSHNAPAMVPYMDDNWGAVKKSYAKQVLGVDKPEISDTELFSGIRGLYQQRKVLQDTAADMAPKIVEAAYQGNADYRALVPKVAKPEQQAQLDEYAAKVSASVQDQAHLLSPHVVKIAGLMEQFRANGEQSLLPQMVDEIEHLNPQQRETVVSMAALKVKNEMGEADNTTLGSDFVGKVGQKMDRSVAGMVQGVRSLAANLTVGQAAGQGKNPYALDPNREDARTQILSAYNAIADPVEGKNLASKVALGLASFAPQMASIMASPAVGLPAVFAESQNQRASDLMGQGVPRTDAFAMAAPQALVDALSQMVSTNIVFKGALAPIEATSARSMSDVAMRTLKVAGAEAVTLSGITAAQQFMPLAIQDWGHRLDQSIPETQWADSEDGKTKGMLHNLKDALPETALSVVALMMLGTGRAGLAETRKFAASLGHVDALVAAGYTPEQANKVADQASPQDRLRVLQSLKPEGVNTQGQADAIAKLDAENKAAKQDRAAVVSKSDDNQTFVVSDADGKRIGSATTEEAANDIKAQYDQNQTAVSRGMKGLSDAIGGEEVKGDGETAKPAGEAAAPGGAATAPKVEAEAESPALRQVVRSAQDKWADKILDEHGKLPIEEQKITPEVAAAITIKGVGLLDSGVTDFDRWSGEMRDMFGDNVEPHLRQIYDDAAGLHGELPERGAAQAAKAAIEDSWHGEEADAGGARAQPNEDGTWTVVDRAGKEVGRADSPEQAVDLVRDTNKADSAKLSDVVKDGIEYFKERGATKGEVEQTGEKRTVQDKVKQKEMTNDQAKALVKLYVDLGILEPGTTPAQARIYGENARIFNARTKLYDYITRLHEGADPLVLIEEKAEEYFKHGLDNGHFTLSDVERWRSDLEGKPVTPNGNEAMREREATEWFSQHAQAYIVGKSVDNPNSPLPLSVRRWLQRAKEMFANTFALAKSLMEREDAGQLPDGFKKHLARSVGLDEAFLEQRARDEEAAGAAKGERASYTAKEALHAIGLPTPGSDLTGMSGELSNLYESLKFNERMKIFGRKRTGPAGEFENAKGLDEVAERLRADYGFSWVKGPDDVIKLAEDAFLNGKDAVSDTSFALRRQTETPEFKAWFGGSKVVDADGKPAVMYHGTSTDITKFNMPAFFTDLPENTEFYSMERGEDEGGRTIPVFLSIKKPLIAQDRAGAQEMIAIANRAGIKIDIENFTDGSWDTIIRDHGDAPETIGANHNDLVYSKAFRDQLAKEGYDGLHASDGFFNGDIDIWVPVSPEQIKSATGNRGAFDATNPDITMSLRKPKGDKTTDMFDSGLAGEDFTLNGEKAEDHEGTVAREEARRQAAKDAADAQGEMTFALRKDQEADRAEYDRLQAEMRAMGYEKMGTPEFNALWQKSEDIKNRNGGMPPGETAGVPEHSRAQPQDENAPVVHLPDGTKLVGPSTFAIRAHHGTPHQVDEFSTDKIGSGQGAQTYGWGLYFAENKKVAEGYRESLAPDRGMEPHEIANRIMKAVGWDEQKALAEVASRRAKANSPQSKEHFDKIEDAIKSGKTANLYTLDIVPEADQFLHWDKPLSQQSEQVQAAIKPAIDEILAGHYADKAQFKDGKLTYLPGTADRYGDKGGLREFTGSDLLNAMKIQELVNTDSAGDRPDKVVSEKLLAAGVPGIRYLDEQSRVEPRAGYIYGKEGHWYVDTPNGVEKFPAGDTAETRTAAEAAWQARIAELKASKTHNIVLFDGKLAKIIAANGRPVNADGSTFALRPAKDGQLIAVHNTNADKLRQMDELGGMAAPSIAVVKHGTSRYDSFGDISLVAHPDVIDPRVSKKAKVFNADVYSPRFPQVRSKVNEGALRTAWKSLGESSTALGHSLSREIDVSEVQKDGLDAFEQSAAVKHAFLKEKGIDPAIKMRGDQEYPESLTRFKAKDRWALENDPEFEKAVADYYRKEYTADGALAQILDENGKVKAGPLSRVAAGVHAQNNPEPDYHDSNGAMLGQIEKAGLTGDFRNWIKDKFGDVVSGKQVRDYNENTGTVKNRPYELDSIVRMMKRSLRDGEGFNYGVGSIRATQARQFKSLADIKASAGDIVPKEQIEQVKGQFDDEFMRLADELRPYYRFDSKRFGYLDEASQAFKELGQHGYGLRKWEENYKDTPLELLDQVKGFLKQLAAAPSEYFEAKVQRGVKLNEMAGAVIPHDTSPETRALLAKHGLQTVEYQASDADARAKALAQFGDSSFSLRPNGLPEVAGGKPGQQKLPGELDQQAKEEQVRAAKENQRVAGLTKFGPFREALNRFVGTNQLTSLRVEREVKRIMKEVPDAARRVAITNYLQANGDLAALKERAEASAPAYRRGYEDAMKLTPREKSIAASVSQFYKDMLVNLQKHEVVDAGVENYVNQMWKQEVLGEDPKSPHANARLMTDLRNAKERVFGSYFEGEQAGKIPVTKDIAHLMAIYATEAGKVVASRRFLKDLTTKKAADGRPLAAVQGQMESGENVGVETGDKTEGPTFIKANAHPEGYKTIDNPAFQGWKFLGKDKTGESVMMKGQMALHPDIFRHMENVFGSSEIDKALRPNDQNGLLLRAAKTFARGLLKAQTFAKGTTLGFLSPFHQVQEGTHALGHHVNPFWGSPDHLLDPDNPLTRHAVDHGLMIAGDGQAMQMFKDSIDSNLVHAIPGLLGKIPKVGEALKGATESGASPITWSKEYAHYLFHSYIPRMKMKTFMSIEGNNLERYAKEMKAGTVTRADVAYLSAKQTNNAYGHLNWQDIGANPTILHMARLAFLAPDFLAARLAFTGEAIKGAAGKKSGREQILAFASLAATQYITARILNKFADDDYHFDKPFSVVHDGREYTMRSVPEDIYKMVKQPEQFIKGRISPGLNMMQEALFQRNFRGEKVDYKDELKDMASMFIPITLRANPLYRQYLETGGKSTVSVWQQLVGAAGIHISRNSPIAETYKMAGDFKKSLSDEDKKKFNVAEDKGVYPTSKYQQLRYALEDGDMGKAMKEYEKLKDGGAAKLAEGFKESLFHPFTGSKHLDAVFAKSLPEEKRAMIDLAQHSRAQIWQAFKQVEHGKVGLVAGGH